MTKKQFRTAFWSEILLLELVTLLFVLPLKLNLAWLSASNSQMAIAYYAASSIVILTFQIVYMYPLNEFRVNNKLMYAAGMLVVIGSVYFWLSGASNRMLDFQHIEQGAVLGPSVFGVFIPVIQAFTSFSFTSLGSAARQSPRS